MKQKVSYQLASSVEAADYGNGARRQFDGFIQVVAKEDLTWLSGADIAGRFCVSVNDGRYILSEARKLKDRPKSWQVQDEQGVQNEKSIVSTELSPPDDERVKVKSAEAYYEIALQEEQHNFVLLDELRRTKENRGLSPRMAHYFYMKAVSESASSKRSSRSGSLAGSRRSSHGEISPPGKISNFDGPINLEKLAKVSEAISEPTEEQLQRRAHELYIFLSQAIRVLT